MSITAATAEGNVVSVDFDDGARARFASVWLRDACRCSLCRTPGTFFRLDDARYLDPDLTVVQVVVVDGGQTLRCTWPDSHQTDLAAAWLSRHTPDRPGPGSSDHRLWFGGFEPEVAGYAELASAERYLRWLESLWTHGIALVTDMPTDRAELVRFAQRMGPVRASNYGPDWEIEASPTPDTPVYSSQGLRVHTDLPYREVPPGVQFNLSVAADAAGGESIMADGFAIADELRRNHPDAFTMLTTVDVPVGYVTPEHDLRWSAPPIGLDSTGRCHLIRYAPGLVGPVAADPDTTREAYRAYRLFTDVAADPRFEIARRLEPGQLLAIHNHRVLHGRRPFDLSTGRRNLLGCYLDVDDLHSTIRKLRRTVSA